jgi:hypothetical protein
MEKMSVKRKILVQTKINEYKDKGHTVFYTDELWVDSNLTFPKC